MVLPSKKILSAFVLMAGLVVSVIIVFGEDKNSIIGSANNLVAGERLSLPENPNWQNDLGRIEALNTNIDPLAIAESQNQETMTDIVSRSLMANYLALRGSGELDGASAQKLVDQTINLVDELGVRIPLEVNLNIILDDGRRTIADYGENLGNILRNDKLKAQKNELEIINTAIISKDQSKLDELDSIISVYQEIADNLTKMPVPRTFVKAHTDMVNGVSGMAIALKESKNIFADPIVGLASMKLHNQSFDTFVAAMSATLDFIKSNKINYEQGSGGYYLLYGIQ